jgi:phenylpropionate dioxygenase-like ring-hydroxylating dioxygenase large terminal subunit
MPLKQIPPLLTNTWVFIGYVNEVKNETVKSVTYMNKNLILWKSKAGVISLQDAYCPHMGAHLGFGKVHEENLICAFHKRSFNNDGICIGRGKKNKSYPLSQIQHLIFAWFGEDTPSWHMPNFFIGFPNDSSLEWKIFKSKKMNYDFHPKDLLDNTVDALHFKTFHKQCISYKPIEILKFSAYYFISKVVFLGNPNMKMGKKDMELELITESYGPCTLVVNSTVKVLNQKFIFKFLFLCTPLVNDNTDYTLAVCSVVDTKNIPLTRRILEYIYNYYAFYMQVKEFKKESNIIWKNKTYLATPDLSEKETAMLMYTKWYEKFYIKTIEKNKETELNCEIEF